MGGEVIKAQVGETMYRIDFEHDIPDESITCRIWKNTGDAETSETGVAWLEGEHGRTVSLSRAMDKLSLSREQRVELWRAYHDHEEGKEKDA